MSSYAKVQANIDSNVKLKAERIIKEIESLFNGED